MNVYFIRHGEYDHKLSRLSDRGVGHARMTGKYFKHHRLADDRCDAIFCSPSEKTRQTADLIAGVIGYDKSKIIFDARLREGHNKSVQSGSDRQIQELYDKYAKKYVDPIEREIHLNEFDGEIAKKFSKETNQEIFIGDMIKNNYKNVIIVSHNSVMHFGLLIIFNLPVLMQMPMGKMIDSGSCWISYITYHQNEYRMITAPNNEHLLIDHSTAIIHLSFSRTAPCFLRKSPYSSNCFLSLITIL